MCTGKVLESHGVRNHRCFACLFTCLLGWLVALWEYWLTHLVVLHVVLVLLLPQEQT